jgi:hypothetical protein
MSRHRGLVTYGCRLPYRQHTHDTHVGTVCTSPKLRKTPYESIGAYFRITSQ